MDASKKIYFFSFLICFSCAVSCCRANDTSLVARLLLQGDSIAVSDKWAAYDLYFKADSLMQNLLPGKAYLSTTLLAVRCKLACGNISYRVDDYNLSMQCYLKASSMLNTIHDQKQIKVIQAKARLLLGFGNLQFSQDNLIAAMRYAREAKELALKHKYNEGIARAWILIGHIYHSACYIGLITEDTGRAFHQRSIDAFAASLPYSKLTGDTVLQFHAYINLGGVYHDWGRLTIAEKYYLQSINILEERIQYDTTDRRNYALLGGACTSLGNLYKDREVLYKEMNWRQTSEYWRAKGLQYAVKGGNKPSIAFSARCLAEAERANEKNKEAYEHVYMARNIEAQIFSENNSRLFNEMEARYQNAVKEKQLTEERFQRKKQENIKWSLAGGLVFLLLITLILIRSYRIKQRDNRIIAEEKKRGDELLLNILPSEVAEELKQYGATQAKMYDLVTVFFTDFKDFTRIAEQMTPQELVHEIDFCFREFDKIIGRYSIEKIKTIGDAYMCAGGLPVPTETHPRDVVNAAVEIIEFMKEYQGMRIAKGKPHFEIRIGIHTGPVVAGIVGIKKFAYDIWGDTVNIAARLESSGAPGRINVSKTTHEMIKDRFHCTYRGKIEVKNKGLLDMYFVEKPIVPGTNQL